MDSSSPNRALSWFIVAWVTVGLSTIAFLIRIYSRAVVTRSIGSDDFALAISTLLTITGAIINSAQFHYGLGRHQADLSSEQYAQEQKWEYIAWIVVFINYFFLRASVLLFVLRLLPQYKKVQRRVIYVEFFVNFAITLAATVTYGLGCIPFRALYTNVPGAKCFSKEKLVVVAQVNAILSCCIDITISLVPVFLLWGVDIKPSTKRVLNVIFCFGIITAAMSIGRAATTTKHNLETDPTWRSLPSKWFGMVEDNFGVGFACAPVIRQLYAYYHRTGTLLPGEDRQQPNEDFRKMRRKVNIRDIFWYRQAILKDGRVSDAHPIFQPQSDTDTESLVAPERLPTDAPPATHRSVMDWWEDKFKKIFSRLSASQSNNTSAAKRHKPDALRRQQGELDPLLPSPDQDSTLPHQEDSRNSAKSRSLGSLSSRQHGEGGNSTRGTFLSDASAGGNSALGSRSETEHMPDDLESSLESDPFEFGRLRPSRSDASRS